MRSPGPTREAQARAHVVAGSSISVGVSTTTYRLRDCAIAVPQPARARARALPRIEARSRWALCTSAKYGMVAPRSSRAGDDARNRTQLSVLVYVRTVHEVDRARE